MRWVAPAALCLVLAAQAAPLPPNIKHDSSNTIYNEIDPDEWAHNGRIIDEALDSLKPKPGDLVPDGHGQLLKPRPKACHFPDCAGRSRWSSKFHNSFPKKQAKAEWRAHKLWLRQQRLALHLDWLRLQKAEKEHRRAELGLKTAAQEENNRNHYQDQQEKHKLEYPEALGDWLLRNGNEKESEILRTQHDIEHANDLEKETFIEASEWKSKEIKNDKKKHDKEKHGSVRYFDESKYDEMDRPGYPGIGEDEGMENLNHQVDDSDQKEFEQEKVEEGDHREDDH